MLRAAAPFVRPDINGDGKLAILLALCCHPSRPSPNEPVVRRYTQFLPVGGSPLATVVADVNHDGILDVLVADGTTTMTDSFGVQHQTVAEIAVLIGTNPS